MNYTITARIEDRRRPCTLCSALSYSDGHCATCKAAFYVGKVVKTASANYRQRNGVIEIKRVGETRFAPLAA